VRRNHIALGLRSCQSRLCINASIDVCPVIKDFADLFGSKKSAENGRVDSTHTAQSAPLLADREARNCSKWDTTKEEHDELAKSNTQGQQRRRGLGIYLS
jgi:hypothetical protein